MTNQIEWMRKQLQDQQKTTQGKADLLQALDPIDRKLQDVDYRLSTRADALSDDKFLRTAYNLYQNFTWLNGEIGTGAGDVAGSGDYGPTEAAIGLVLDLEKQLQLHAVEADYKSVMEKDVPAFNRQIEGSGLAPLKTTGAPPTPPRSGGRFRRRMNHDTNLVPARNWVVIVCPRVQWVRSRGCQASARTWA